MRRAVQIVVSFVVGLVFGLGLLLSHMSDPAKVLGFLDLAGRWDPSLALVMAGAIGVGLPAFAIAERRRRTLLDTPMRLPATRAVDRPLIAGAVLFGIGWGLAGFCPGPALVALTLGGWKAAAFVAAMVAGMGGHDILREAIGRKSRRDWIGADE